MAVKLLVDSASDVDLAQAKELGVELISMEVRFGEEEFLDGVNLSREEFFAKLASSNEIPKTSQINVYQFEEKFEKMCASGDEVIAIVLSSKLSGTHNSAVEASKRFLGKVWVVDSQTVTIGERILVLLALRLIKEGKSAKEMVEILELMKHKIKLYAVLDTLKYLRKGGRISAMVAFAGEMLSIKPVVSITNGEVKLEGKAIGIKKGNKVLVDLVRRKEIDFSLPYVTAYSGVDRQPIEKFHEDAKNLWEGRETPKVFLIGSTIGTHVGPGAVAIAYFEK